MVSRGHLQPRPSYDFIMPSNEVQATEMQQYISVLETIFKLLGESSVRARPTPDKKAIPSQTDISSNSNLHEVLLKNIEKPFFNPFP